MFVVSDQRKKVRMKEILPHLLQLAAQTLTAREESQNSVLEAIRSLVKKDNITI